MAQKKTIVLVCDLCEGENLVRTHQLAVNGNAVEVDACERCWGEVLADFAAVAKVGRKVKRKRTPKRDVMAFPGTAWDFTAHALIRMGERHIQPRDAAASAERPTVTRPGRDVGSEIRQAGGVKVVVVPAQRRILTVSRPDEDEDA